MKRVESRTHLAEPQPKRRRIINDIVNKLAQDHSRSCIATSVARRLIREIMLAIITHPNQTAPAQAPTLVDAVVVPAYYSGESQTNGSSSAPVIPIAQTNPVFRIDYAMIMRQLALIQWYEQFTSLKKIISEQCNKRNDIYLAMAKRITIQNSMLQVNGETLYLLRAICYCVVSGVRAFLITHGNVANQTIETAMSFIVKNHLITQMSIISAPIALT